MATTEAQRKWRNKNQLVKTQLNVMARRLVHADLDEIAAEYGLRGKGEAVGFATFLAKGLMQYSAHNAEAKRLLGLFANAFERDRDLYK